MLKFTVFTPVRNRKKTINRVWESLLCQTYKNFEWIIIDNESTDDILPLLYDYQKKADFPITVISHVNRGLHFSYNKAVQRAKGELFVIMDSDDKYESNTLERYNYWWQFVKNEYDEKKFSGINVLCKNPENEKVIGDEYPSNPFISNSLDLHYKYKLKGEKWGCVRTDLLKTRLFPEENTEGVYFPETYVWNYLAKRYNILCVNEAPRYYYMDTGNQITKKKSKKVKSIANARYPYQLFQFNENLFYIFKYDKKEALRLCIDFWRIALNSNKSIPAIFNDITLMNQKIVASLFLIPSWILTLLFKSKFHT